MPNKIHIISAPSILGLKPGGVALLGKSLVEHGLLSDANLSVKNDFTEVPHLNALYNPIRDEVTACLNPNTIRQFSERLHDVVEQNAAAGKFPVVLGGDCSILLGILPVFKPKGNYGLIFMDAHADFYQGNESPTGEVADMDLAIATGRGPEILTNMHGRRPYVNEEHVIHVGQRDAAETEEYGATDIRKTRMRCLDFAAIQVQGIEQATQHILDNMQQPNLSGWWLHFDTDLLADEINPAVDYRLPGGLQWHEAEYLMSRLLQTRKITGISVTIYNPLLDPDNMVAPSIVRVLSRVFQYAHPIKAAG